MSFQFQRAAISSANKERARTLPPRHSSPPENNVNCGWPSPESELSGCNLDKRLSQTTATETQSHLLLGSSMVLSILVTKFFSIHHTDVTALLQLLCPILVTSRFAKNRKTKLHVAGTTHFLLRTRGTRNSFASVSPSGGERHAQSTPGQT